MTSIDVSSTPTLDEHLAAATARLPRLRCVIADHCRKLTPSITHCSTRAPASSSALAALQQLSLQRCFQLTASTLRDLLCSTQARAARLQYLALSHLDLTPMAMQPADSSSTTSTSSACSEHSASTEDVEISAASASASCYEVSQILAGYQQQPVVSSLRVLALHCCSPFPMSALMCIANAAPQLETLLLGGSQFAKPTRDDAVPRYDAVWQVVEGLRARAASLPTLSGGLEHSDTLRCAYSTCPAAAQGAA